MQPAVSLVRRAAYKLQHRKDTQASCSVASPKFTPHMEKFNKVLITSVL